jgi:hypothetical protein
MRRVCEFRCRKRPSLLHTGDLMVQMPLQERTVYHDEWHTISRSKNTRAVKRTLDAKNVKKKELSQG